MNMRTSALLISLLLVGCDKKEKGTLARGWDGSSAGAGCNYAPQTYSGALLNQDVQIIPIQADPVASPYDKLSILICYDAACTNPYKAVSCTPMRSSESCFTSMPSPHINTVGATVKFAHAYEAGFRGYFISEAVCN